MRQRAQAGVATTPRDTDSEPAAGATATLSPGQCWELLGSRGILELAVRAVPDGVDVFPIDYLVANGCVYFRTGPGTKLMDISANPLVALHRTGAAGDWTFSVTVHGRAERIAFDEEIEASGVLGLVSTAPGEKFNYVKVTPSRITGTAFCIPSLTSRGSASGREAS